MIYTTEHCIIFERKKSPLRVRFGFYAGVLNMFVISQNKEFNLARFTEEFGKSVPTYHIGFIGAAGAKIVFHDNHFLFFDLGYQYSQTMNVWPDLRFVSSLFEFKAGFSF